jgi:hypothetical protein
VDRPELVRSIATASAAVVFPASPVTAGEPFCRASGRAIPHAKEVIMRLSVLIVLLVALPLSAHAQEPAKVAPRTMVGFELDVLPYLSGGYYASA